MCQPCSVCLIVTVFVTSAALVRSVGRHSYVIVLKNNSKKISVYLLVSAVVYHRGIAVYRGVHFAADLVFSCRDLSGMYRAR